MDRTQSVSFIMAGYNEAAVARRSIEAVWQVLRQSFEDFELILVDDGSADETLSVMRRCAEQYPGIRVLENGINLNYGASVLRGMCAARKDWIVYDAFDLEMKPEDFVRAFQATDAETDFVVFQRETYEAVPRRKFASLCNRALLRVLFPRLTRGTPVLNHTQMFRRACIRQIIPLSRSPIFFSPEMVFRAKVRKMTWINEKIPFHSIDGVRKGAFGHVYDILWAVADMLRFRFRLWRGRI